MYLSKNSRKRHPERSKEFQIQAVKPVLSSSLHSQGRAPGLLKRDL